MEIYKILHRIVFAFIRMARFLMDLKSYAKFPKDKIHFISPYGLGDSFILLLLLDQFEELQKKKVFFCIKKSHASVFDLMGMKDYAVVDITRLPGRTLALLNEWKKPQAGKFFWGHMEAHSSFKPLLKKFTRGEMHLAEMYHLFLNLKGEKVQIRPAFVKNAKNWHIKTIEESRLQNSILICPEAKSLSFSMKSFWEELILELCSRGYEVFENKSDVTLHNHEGSKKVDLSLTDVIALGHKCKFVVSSRSGLSDLLASRGKDQIVIYPDDLSFNQYSLIKMYGLDSNEIILKQKSKNYSGDVKSILSLMNA